MLSRASCRSISGCAVSVAVTQFVKSCAVSVRGSPLDVSSLLSRDVARVRFSNSFKEVEATSSRHFSSRTSSGGWKSGSKMTSSVSSVGSPPLEGAAVALGSSRSGSSESGFTEGLRNFGIRRILAKARLAFGAMV